MMKYPNLSPAPTREETLWGIMWLVVSMIMLPAVLSLGNLLLGCPLSDGLLNFVYYCLNFCITVWLFRRFLRYNLEIALKRPFAVLWYSLLGYLGQQALTELLTYGIFLICPDFSNVNDSNIYAMLEEDLIPLAIGTVFLVPLAEETLHRGLVFRGLFDRNPTLSYLVSMVVFAAIHVVGYIGIYPPLTLLMCFLQYLPAGYCLCWCYRQTGTILSPILLHTLVNATGIYYAVR